MIDRRPSVIRYVNYYCRNDNFRWPNSMLQFLHGTESLRTLIRRHHNSWMIRKKTFVTLKIDSKNENDPCTGVCPRLDCRRCRGSCCIPRRTVKYTRDHRKWSHDEQILLFRFRVHFVDKTIFRLGCYHWSQHRPDPWTVLHVKWQSQVFPGSFWTVARTNYQLVPYSSRSFLASIQAWTTWHHSPMSVIHAADYPRAKSFNNFLSCSLSYHFSVVYTV